MSLVSWSDFVSFDLPALLTALCTAVTCALLGSILVLRKQSLMGDAISHSVLPGIVLAFLLTGSRDSLSVFVGAAVAGIFATTLIGLVKSLGRLDSGAAMGVVFSLFFALGVVLIEQAAARNVDLDADCLLHGQLEHIFWFPPERWLQTLPLTELPFELIVSFMVCVVCFLAVFAFFKEWKLISFDPGLARSLGFPVVLLNNFFLVLLAIAVVSSFYVVGTILVIAFLICPGASARMFTDNFAKHISLSILFAMLSVLLGYSAAAWLPLYLGYESSLNAAGSICVLAGILLLGSAIFAPQYGMVSRFLRKLQYRIEVEAEDLLALLYRRHLESRELLLMPQTLWDRLLRLCAERSLIRDGFVNEVPEGILLSPEGVLRGKQVVRSHRQWEHYLVEEVGLRSDHVHERATEFEHVTSGDIPQKLNRVTEDVLEDPHGKEIPEDECKK